ncbi:MAG TPA: Na+/H+ antiporter NhaA [Solirubrobacteraceae bacterium]|nr:Na+/H+ antiporter NhaA [Solirubrobacteraceae bacterium]
MATAQATPLTGRTAWARNLAAPVRDFLSTETGSAIVLLTATIAALLWANSPWPDSYESVWTTELSFRLGDWALSADLREWVNDGLMTLFFLVVGLEAKRELDLGELRDRKRLALPVVGALGGMIVPIAIYVAFNAGGRGGDGWGAAMSTDTAFALGLLALAAPRGSTRLRVFLLTLAVVDDLCALLIIATAYSEHVSMTALAIAVGLFGVLVALRYAPVGRAAAAAVVGTAIWVAMFKSGIHPTIAGLAIGLVTSAYPPARGDLERATETFRSFREQPTPELARTAQLSLVSAISANERLQYRLHPWTSYAIVPLFALANAGITFSSGLFGDALRSPVTLGIVLGYVVGKPAGIVGASWLATRRVFGGQRLPISWPGLGGVGAVAGIGFTVSLLISSLAFRGQLLDEAKVGILSGAVLSALSAWAAFRLIALIPPSTRARQLRGTADELLDLTEDVDPEVDHLRGRRDAPVILLEYGDYECPYCGQAETVVRELLDSFGDDLCYVWRHLPLSDVHPRAQMAAEVAEAAGAQGRFWEMHDMLLSHQDELLPMQIRRHAEELGLDVDRLWDDVHRRAHAPRIARDVASADESGVSGTPTFFINARRHQGAYDSATLTAEVRAARGALSTGQSSNRR